jgi:RimJ/RimL family protein N-acetyltransferase
MNIISLQGKNTKVRPFKEKDLEKFFDMATTSKLGMYFFPDYFLSQYKFKKRFYDTGLLEENGGYILVVDYFDNILGYVWYAKSTCFEGMILNYHLFQDEENYLMIEALSLFSKHLFSSQKINRLQVFIPNYDRRAMTIAQQSKFTFEGIIRQAIFDDGKYVDLCIYSMLREENV